MKTIQQQRLKFLNETVNYYSEDTSRRAAVEQDICKYFDSYTSNKCAIGRHIKMEDYRKNQIEGLTVDAYKVFALLPYEIRVLGQKFLSEVQYLHDSGRHWNSTGLTEAGEMLVQRIKLMYCI